MRFVIVGEWLHIALHGDVYSFPNTDVGYRQMAAEWWQRRNA